MLGTTNVRIKPKGKIKYVDYIESTGTQYIDTSVVPKNTTKIKIDFEYTNVASGRQGWGSSSNAESFVFGIEMSTGTFTTNISDSWVIQDTGIAADTNRHTFELKSGSQKLDGVEFGTSTISNTATSSQTLWLFGYHAEWTTSLTEACNIKIYSCQIYDNDVLVRYFKPAIDGAGVYCLYDKVEQRYYYNQGTGELGGDGYIEPIPETTGLLMDFDDNLVDKTGLTEPKLISNTATFTEGKFGKAIYLPSGEYVSIPLTAETTLGTGDFTVAGWFNIAHTSSSMCLWSFAYEASSSAYWQGVQIWYNAKICFCCDLNASSKNRKDTTTTLTTNTWYHIAMVRYNNTVTVYVNGKNIGTLSANGTVYQNAKNDWKIGASSSTSQYPIRETFKGKVDDFIIVKKALWTSNFVPPTLPYGGVEK